MKGTEFKYFSIIFYIYLINITFLIPWTVSFKINYLHVIIELYRNNCGSLRGLENAVEPLALQAVFACIEISRSPKLPLIFSITQ